MTPRQKQLLNAIIQEFIDTAEAVGSLNIPVKYKIKASPATIRNEMARLVQLGYLEKPHSSSGRVPTTTGIKYYLQELLEEIDEIEYSIQTEMKERMHQLRYNKKDLIMNALTALAELTGNAAIALIDSNVYYSGVSSLLDFPEFQDLKKLRSILSVLENYSLLFDMFSEYGKEKDIKVLVGEETGLSNFEKYAVVFTPITLHGESEGFLSIVGPNRMKYSVVIPTLRTVANNIENVVRGW